MPPKKRTAKQLKKNQQNISSVEPKPGKKVITEIVKKSIAKDLLNKWIESHLIIDQRISLDKEEKEEEEIIQEQKVKNIIKKLSQSAIQNNEDSDISADIEQQQQQQQKKQKQKPQKKQDDEQDSDLSANNSDNEDQEDDSTDSVLSNLSQQQYSWGQKKKGFQKVLLANTWTEDIDPTGMYMSEKLDGIRGYWDGHQIYSRNGNPFKYPKDFTKNWPKVPLDGELFLGRGQFQECSKIVLNRTNASQSFQKDRDLDEEKYKQIVYRVFDLPQSELPFKERVKVLQSEIPKIDSKTIQYQPHSICKGHEHLKKKLNKILAKNGEGLMLRLPDSLYERKRSKTILKVKIFKDSEAYIIGDSMGGKDSCRCYDIYDHEKKEFAIRGQYTKGKTVTYKYFELTHNGIPRFPTFLRYYHKQ